MTHGRSALAIVLAALAAAAAAASPASDPTHPVHHHDGAHAIQHVFIIVLENEGFEKTFGANSEAPYLSKELPQQGVLLTQYFGIGHASLDNYIAMISGQAATPETRSDWIRICAPPSGPTRVCGPGLAATLAARGDRVHE